MLELEKRASANGKLSRSARARIIEAQKRRWQQMKQRITPILTLCLWIRDGRLNAYDSRLGLLRSEHCRLDTYSLLGQLRGRPRYVINTDAGGQLILAEVL